MDCFDCYAFEEILETYSGMGGRFVISGVPWEDPQDVLCPEARPETAEHRLCVALIHRAVLDAIDGSVSLWDVAARDRLRAEAVSWILSNDDAPWSFNFVSLGARLKDKERDSIKHFVRKLPP